MADDIYFIHRFDNGLTLVVERMRAVRSAAMTLMVPAGSAGDPKGACGSATVLSDLVLRGAGSRDSRQLTDYLDHLGLQRSSSVGVQHTRFGCAALAERVMEGLEIYGDIVRRPRLPDNGFAAARDLSLQALEGIDDDPRQKLMIKLREWHLPWPYGRNAMGQKEDLQAMTVEQCRTDFSQRYRSNDAIIALAGDVDFMLAQQAVEKALGDWQPRQQSPLTQLPPPGSFHHEHQQSEQTHIGLAWPSILETDPDYYVVRLAMEALSGGMSGRLFTEVREKRGLAYSVWAGYSSLKQAGFILGYAGTSNERAQETLDCFLEEVRRFGDGITSAELDRAKTGLKSATIMQGESSAARAGAIAHDYYIHGRVRTLDEIKSAIDSVSLDRINAWLKANPAGPFTIVTVGPRELKI